MRLVQVSSIIAAFATKLPIVHSDEYPPPVSDETDEAKPLCPTECGITTEYVQHITERVMKKELTLGHDSCMRKRDDVSKVTSFNFNYHILEGAEIAIELEESEMIPEDFEGRHRRLQSIESLDGPISSTPPAPGFELNHSGWRIEIADDSNEGYCISVPKIYGPFPQANLTSCINELEFACFQIEEHKKKAPKVQPVEKCPCYDEDVMEKIKMKLMNRMYDPDFQLDMNLSCKPEIDGSLPFGIYTKPNGIYNKKYGSTLRYGVDVSLNRSPIDTVLDKCYNEENEEGIRLTFGQTLHCTSLMQKLCGFVGQVLPPPEDKPKFPDSSCFDDADHRFKGKEWATCEKYIGRASRRKKRRICKRIDKNSEKLIFQICRKTCQMCTCRDNSDYIFNSNPEFTCDWLSTLHPRERKSICKTREVRENCNVTCGSRCCRDNPNFWYWKESDDHDYDERHRKLHGEYRTCKDVTNANWKEECQIKKVAVNCPQICRKCFIQPRMG